MRELQIKIIQNEFSADQVSEILNAIKKSFIY